MNLYIQQKVFTLTDKFSVCDEAGNERYFVSGDLLSFTPVLRIYDPSGTELLTIERQFGLFSQKYSIYKGDKLITEVVKKFSLFNPYYIADSLGWVIRGDFLGYNYCISENDRAIVDVSKQFGTFGDAYELRITSDTDELPVLAVALIIDNCRSR